MITFKSRMSIETSKLLILLSIPLLLFGCGMVFEEKLDEYTSDEGRFSVSMPGKPGKKTQSVSTGVGSIEMHMVTVEKTTTAYMVVYSDYPVEIIKHSDPDDLLEAAKKGAMQNIDGKITQEELISYGDDPGIELSFSAEGGKGKGQALIVLSGNRLYQVIAIGSNLLYPEKTIKKFLDSFSPW